MKFETKLPNEICPEIRTEMFVLSWQAEKSSPKISLDFSHRKFQISNRIPNQISPKISQTHFCRLGSPKKGLIGGNPSPKSERAPTPLRVHKTLILFWGEKIKGGLHEIGTSCPLGVLSPVCLDRFRQVWPSCRQETLDNCVSTIL